MTETTNSFEKHRTIIVITVLLGMFCASMEAMVTATLMPSILSSMSGGFNLYPWVPASYLLASVTASPLFGALADIYGYKRIYRLALVIFLLGSALCGFSSSMQELIAARAVQGLGSAGLISLSVILFGVIFPVEQRAKMQACISGTWAISSILGPTIGALSVEYFSWRWAFFINVPCALVILAATMRFGNLSTGTGTRKLDWMGSALFCLATGPTVAMLLSAGQLHFGMPETFAAIIGITFTVLFLRHLRSSSDPLIPVSLFKNRVAGISVTMVAIVGGLLFSVVNFLPLFVQGVMGLPPRTAGYVVTVVAVGMFFGSVVSGLLLNRIGFRRMATIGAVLIAVGFAGLAMVLEDAVIWQLVICNSCIGVGLAIISNTLIVAMQAIATNHTIGSASSLMHFFRMFGGTVFIALMGGIQLGSFRRDIQSWLGSKELFGAAHEIFEAPQKIFDPLERQAITLETLSSLAHSLMQSLQYVFFACLVAAFVLFWLASRMPTLTPKQLVDEES
ncbi:MAG: MFS transporter [Chlamydiales bacterium]|nr:MFS transporter [Chlamydiales bacterium]